MNITRPLFGFSLIAVACVLAACEPNGSAPPNGTTTTTDTPVAPDNTGRNKTDSSAAKTPIDQSNSADDVKISAEIRRAIMEDSTMSMNAQNCKIITDKAGVVTLRGVVDSQAEKDAIEAKAKAVTGVSRVDNMLEIKSR